MATTRIIPLYAGKDDVIAYHLRQSFVSGEITPEEANRLGVQLARRFTKGNHAFIVCTHIVNYAKTRDTYVSYRKAGYSKKFRQARVAMRELLTVKNNVDRVLAMEQTEPQQKEKDHGQR